MCVLNVNLAFLTFDLIYTTRIRLTFKPYYISQYHILRISRLNPKKSHFHGVYCVLGSQVLESKHPNIRKTASFGLTAFSGDAHTFRDTASFGLIAPFDRLSGTRYPPCMASFRGNNSIWERYHPEHEHLMVNHGSYENIYYLLIVAVGCEVDCEVRRSIR